MSINIKAVNVGDGDAIILTLKNSSFTKIVVIDGGDKGHTKKVIAVLDETLAANGKTSPDLIICTHYDSDHIYGIIEIVRKYKSDISQCWVHKPTSEYKTYISILKEAVDDNNRNMATKMQTIKLFETFRTEPNLLKQVIFTIESYDQLITLEGLLAQYDINTIEPFSENNISLKDFPNFKVLGPSEKFYENFTNTNKSNFVLDYTSYDWEKELLGDAYDDNKLYLLENAQLEVCSKLPTSSISKRVTPVNMVSIIVEFEEDGKKYLFPGDAGIESFTYFPDYKERFSNYYFVLIPHHGSRNNISKELVETFSPKIAFVSAAGKLEKGEIKRPHEYVLNCFNQHKSKVYKTQECINYLELDDRGEVYVK